MTVPELPTSTDSSQPLRTANSNSRRTPPAATLFAGRRLAWLIVPVLAAAFSRLLPHPPNVSPVAAIALFGGACFPRLWMAALTTFAAMLISDTVLYTLVFPEYAGHALQSSLFVYAAFGVTVVIGRVVCRSRRWSRVIGGTLLATAVFFLLTNFGVWWLGNSYPKTAAGLAACYAAALPFLRNSLLGNVFFSVVLFSMAHAAARAALPRVPRSTA